MNPPNPRVLRSRETVRVAALELLEERGYAGFSIDAVSKRCGVARSTIYRHWESGAKLALDALTSIEETAVPASSGDLEADLRSMLRNLATKLASPYGRLLPTLIDAAHRDPEFAALQRSFAERRRSEALQQCGVSLAASGLPPEVDLVVLADQLAGALYLRHLVSLQPIDEEFLDALVQNVLSLIDQSRSGPN